MAIAGSLPLSAFPTTQLSNKTLPAPASIAAFNNFYAITVPFGFLWPFWVTAAKLALVR